MIEIPVDKLIFDCLIVKSDTLTIVEPQEATTTTEQYMDRFEESACGAVVNICKRTSDLMTIVSRISHSLDSFQALIKEVMTRDSDFIKTHPIHATTLKSPGRRPTSLRHN